MKTFRSYLIYTGLCFFAIQPFSESFPGGITLSGLGVPVHPFFNSKLPGPEPGDSALQHGRPYCESCSQFSISDSGQADECILPVPVDDTEHLKLMLANAPEKCVLQLSGLYEVEDELHINRILTSWPDNSEEQSSHWVLPEILTLDSNLSIGATCSINGQGLSCPVQKARSSPGARIVVKRQGRISFSSGGGLHHIGIVDARVWLDSKLPLLVAEEYAKASDLNFNQVVFLRRYPVVSDFDDANPYWNNSELSDAIGGAGKETVSRVVRGVANAFGGRSYIGRFGQRSYSGGNGGGRRPPDQNNGREQPRDYFSEVFKTRTDIALGVMAVMYGVVVFNVLADSRSKFISNSWNSVRRRWEGSLKKQEGGKKP